MTNDTSSDEKELLLRLQKGDENSLNELMEAYKRPLGNNILRILKSKEDTEDTLQELFAKVWSHRGQIDADKPIRAYLFHVTHNLVYDILRKNAAEKKAATNYRQFLTEYYTHVEEVLFAAENRDLLNQLISQLPDRQRQVFELCKLEGKSYRETSALLGISPDSVNKHMSRANVSLRRYISNRPDLTVFLLASFIYVGL